MPRRLHLYVRGKRPLCGEDVDPKDMTRYWLEFATGRKRQPPCEECLAELRNRLADLS